MELFDCFRPMIGLLYNFVDHELVGNGTGPIALPSSPTDEEVMAGDSTSAIDTRSPEEPTTSERGNTSTGLDESADQRLVTLQQDPVLPKNDEATQLRSLIAAQAHAVPKCHLLRFVQKLIWCRYHLSNSYMFNGKPISNRKMTHEIGLSDASGQTVFAAHLKPNDTERIIADLKQMMETTSVSVYNNGPSLLKTCTSQDDLEKVFNRLEQKKQLGGYRATIKAKGLPFLPVFWLLKGLPSNQCPEKVSAEIQSYAFKNEKALGKLRVIYGSCYTIPCIKQFQPVFMGNIMIVTDAETLRPAGNKVPLEFQGIKPRRVQRPEFPL